MKNVLIFVFQFLFLLRFGMFLTCPPFIPLSVNMYFCWCLINIRILSVSLVQLEYMLISLRVLGVIRYFISPPNQLYSNDTNDLSPLALPHQCVHCSPWHAAPATRTWRCACTCTWRGTSCHWRPSYTPAKRRRTGEYWRLVNRTDHIILMRYLCFRQACFLAYIV